MLFKSKMDDGSFPIDTLYEALLNDFQHENSFNLCTSLDNPGNDPREVAANHLITKFYGKYLGKSVNAPQVLNFRSVKERKRAMFDTWISGNDRCEYMNPKFKSPLQNFSERVSLILGEAQLLTANEFENFDYVDLFYHTESVSGLFNSISLVENEFACGKRASTGKSESGINAYPFKYGVDDLVFSSKQSEYTFRLLGHRESWFFASLRGVPVKYTSCTQLSGVPKDVSTLRGVEPQPNGTVVVQLKIGQAIAYRLLKYGIDIKDQSKNQRAALSFTDGLNKRSTVDLRNASGSICYGLVDYLFTYCPLLWRLLNENRMTHTRFEGSTFEHPVHFMSGMGNGYTFPLETWVFYALARSTCIVLGIPPKGVIVYGDDIVIPNGAYDTFMDLLYSLGMSPNLSKSYGGAHPFRESCGTDVYQGTYITAPRPRKQWDTDPVGLHQFLNDLLEWSEFHKIAIPHTLGVYGRLFYGGCINVVPPWESAGSGLRISHHNFPSTWCPYLQCRLYTYSRAVFTNSKVRLYTESSAGKDWQNWRSVIAGAISKLLESEPCSYSSGKRPSKALLVSVGTAFVAFKKHSAPRYLSIHKVTDISTPAKRRSYPVQRYKHAECGPPKRERIFAKLDVRSLLPDKERTFLFDNMDVADPVYSTGVTNVLPLSAALKRAVLSSHSRRLCRDASRLLDLE